MGRTILTKLLVPGRVNGTSDLDKTAGNWRSPVECVNGMSDLDKY